MFLANSVVKQQTWASWTHQSAALYIWPVGEIRAKMFSFGTFYNDASPTAS